MTSSESQRAGFPDKKRQQHHVWQHYLKSWAVDGTIYCLRGDRIFPTGTPVLAVEQDFYKLHQLSQADISLIKLLLIDFPRVHPATKKNHEDFLASLLFPLQFVEQHRDQFKNIELIDEYLDIYRTNILEDHHAAIESRFIPILEMIQRNDLTFYDNAEACISFFHFISTQSMRTKRVKVKTIAIMQEKMGQDLTRVWDIMSLMFATNIGMGLFLERKKRNLTLVHNNTEVPFITGDQPVINLHATGQVAPETLSFYYPISPTMALFLGEVEEKPAFSTDSLTSAQASVLNAKMLEACHSQLFGQSCASLLPLRELNRNTSP